MVKSQFIKNLILNAIFQRLLNIIYTINSSKYSGYNLNLNATAKQAAAAQS